MNDDRDTDEPPTSPEGPQARILPMHVKITLKCEHCHNSSTHNVRGLNVDQVLRYYEHHRRCAQA